MWNKHWQVAIKISLILVLIASLFIPSSPWLSAPLIRTLFDLAHFPVFIVLGFLLSALINRKMSMILLLLLVPFAEALQFYLGRSMDPLDALWGWAGIFVWYALSSIRYWLWLALVVFSIYLLTSIHSLWPHVNSLISIHTIGDFTSNKSLFGWRNIDDSKHPAVELKALESIDESEAIDLALQGGALHYPWTGVSYDWSLPVKLESASTLNFDFFSPRITLDLDIKIVALDGRYNVITRRLMVSGWNSISVPLNQFDVVLESNNIKTISIYYESFNKDRGYQIRELIIDK